MPEGGKVTPISPGIVQRVTQAARYVITGVSPQTWFGPMQPLRPMAPPEVKGRTWDYPTGLNLNYTPRGDEGVSFWDMRALADSCDILRAVIETRKDQIEALDWSVKVKPADGDNKRVTATGNQQKRIEKITAFMESPDKERSFDQWNRMLLEDVFVIDAASVYRWPDRKGDLYALRIIDGAKIKPLIDDYGRRPLPPDPAYQEVLKGIPAVDYTSDELIYLMRNPRSHKLYGYSHVEQIIITVNTAIRRALSQLEYYREGSQPDAFLGLPKDWTQEQITDFQKWWDSIMSGNLGQRRRLKFLPGEFKYQATKEPVLKDEYDDYLTRVICFVFSISPTALVKANNRAVAENQHDQAREEGLAPLQKFIRKFWNRVIAEDFKSPDLVFDYQDDREMDPAVAATIRQGDVKAGIISIDEARDGMGEDALGGAFATPMALTATGYVAIKSQEEQDADSQAQQQAMSDAATARLGHNGGPSMDEHGGGDEAENKEKNQAKQKDEASKLAKGVKKKPNPYLPTTGHRHGNHAPL
jgi:PAS domain-containing protein